MEPGEPVRRGGRPADRRSDKVRRALGEGIVGWTPRLRDRKVGQLASVIAQMNTGRAPDLLGVCEVEDRFVLDLLVAAVERLLPARSYRVVHADTRDARGIDVAFLYDPRLFAVPDGETFFHVVMRRTATRDILQVNFRTRAGRTWTVFATTGPPAVTASSNQPGTATSLERPSPTSTSAPARSTALRRRSW
ncbi:hypothetical protein ACI79J_12755 [Geodermatophilus sp. SYSU D01062]